MDDDEEDYGEYQAQRVEGEGREKVNVWRWGDVGADPGIDEFTAARLGKRMN